MRNQFTELEKCLVKAMKNDPQFSLHPVLMQCWWCEEIWKSKFSVKKSLKKLVININCTFYQPRVCDEPFLAVCLVTVIFNVFLWDSICTQTSQTVKKIVWEVKETLLWNITWQRYVTTVVFLVQLGQDSGASVVVKPSICVTVHQYQELVSFLLS